MTDIPQLKTQADYDGLANNAYATVTGFLELDLSFGNTFMLVTVSNVVDPFNDQGKASSLKSFRITLIEPWEGINHATTQPVSVKVQKVNGELRAHIADVSTDPVA